MDYTAPDGTHYYGFNDDRALIRITSDGTPYNTQVTLADGTDISGLVKRFSFEINEDSQGIPEVNITFSPTAVAIDILGKLSVAQLVQYPLSAVDK